MSGYDSGLKRVLIWAWGKRAWFRFGHSETVSEEKCPKINLKQPFEGLPGVLLDNGNVSETIFVQKTGVFLDIFGPEPFPIVQTRVQFACGDRFKPIFWTFPVERACFLSREYAAEADVMVISDKLRGKIRFLSKKMAAERTTNDRLYRQTSE
ncbi:hypothetical protein SAMN02745687_00892 [Lachnospiraceae bacterium NK3A20]|nr:hypothetical protein SAMN02745687_00892 [Lachnospiraceae bacterium NK3A20]